ncbi:hypothetical protein CK203_027132 [Vitis vinifera]|uniref:Uncharacterized protein n=1 Tax=Vitis vinifera TaxID=29760 RepID=A0A438I685_VITVI|nr:hypothetical protein CK203_027132 [Vitis vinifera]
MEEWQTRRSVAAEEGDQPSRNSSQTGPEPLRQIIDIDKISPRPEDWFASVLYAERTDRSETQWVRRRIPKVPQMLRRTQDFEKFYEPRVISFGPYHHGKPHLQQGEMLKYLFAQSFLDSFHCFALLDLFLLENQLPFEILKLLFEGARFGAATMEEMMKKFITSNITRPPGVALELDLVKEPPSHLLDLLRSGLLGPQPVPEQKGQSGGIWRGICPRETGEQQGDWQSHRNIKELAAAGIYLKPSRTTYLSDISFESYFFFGYLKLPQITIVYLSSRIHVSLSSFALCNQYISFA